MHIYKYIYNSVCDIVYRCSDIWYIYIYTVDRSFEFKNCKYNNVNNNNILYIIV